MKVPEKAINFMIYGFEHSYTVAIATFADEKDIPTNINIPNVFLGNFSHSDRQGELIHCYYLSTIKKSIKFIKNIQDKLLCINAKTQQIGICGAKTYTIKQDKIIAISESQIRNPPKYIIISFRYDESTQIEKFNITMKSTKIIVANYRNDAGTGTKRFVFETAPNKEIIKKCLRFSERCRATNLVIPLNPEINCTHKIKFNGGKMDIYSFEHDYNTGTSKLTCRHGPEKIQSKFSCYDKIVTPHVF
jgi:hypothetical protein